MHFIRLPSGPELVRHGVDYVEEETSDWDYFPRYEARREVRKSLEEEITAEWDERKVEGLVHRLLDERYDDDDEDDEDNGEGDEW